MEGIFAIVSVSKNDCLERLYHGTFCLQHRGQEYCGLSTFDGERIKIRTHRGLVSTTFDNDLPGLEGYVGIGHTSSIDRQPVLKISRHGEFTIGINGFITNAKGLRAELLDKGHSLSTLTDVELVGKLIIDQKGTIADGIAETMKKVQGPCSLVLLSKEGVYGARDTFGRRPLVLGRDKNSWVVASESCAFDSMSTGIERVRDLAPGEIILLAQGEEPKSNNVGSKQSQFCSFEWIYYARPDSEIEGIPVADVRHNLGKFLAQIDSVEADIVGPVPFSGILHEEGYHLESGLPSVEIFLLPQYIQRTYIMPLEARRKEKDKKLRPLTRNVAGKRVILVDDSIRSGITMKGLVEDLKKAGAKEVHVRIASPPSIRYCPYERPPLEGESFIASHMGIEEIRKFIKADSLIFQELDKVPEAIGLPPESLCLDCFKG